MAKKRAPKRRVWNKGLEVGKRDGFTPDQVKRIRGLLADRGVPGLRDLALFSTAIDTMLHGQDLLGLVVGDVQRCCLSAAFSASSRLLGVKIEAPRFKRKNISATIVAGVKRFGHPIKRMRFSAHTGRPSC